MVSFNLVNDNIIFRSLYRHLFQRLFTQDSSSFILIFIVIYSTPIII